MERAAAREKADTGNPPALAQTAPPPRPAPRIAKATPQPVAPPQPMAAPPQPMAAPAPAPRPQAAPKPAPAIKTPVARAPAPVVAPAPPLADATRPAPVAAPATSVAAPVAPVAAPAPRPVQTVLPAPARPERESLLDAPVRASFVPDTGARVASADSAADAPATARAVIVFANITGENCGACDRVKLSVTPSGEVLIEHTYLASDWRYRRQITHVPPASAAAFANRLSALRLSPDQADAPACTGPAPQDDGVMIEWIEAGRHDQFTFRFGCAARRNSALADMLRHAPDALGLRRVVFPWQTAR